MTQIYEGLKEQKTGDITSTKVSEVIRGKAHDLMSKELIEASEYPVPADLEVIKLTTENGTVEFFNLPKDGVVKPKHRLARFKATYGSYPEVGLEIKTMLNNNGFNRVVLSN